MPHWGLGSGVCAGQLVCVRPFGSVYLFYATSTTARVTVTLACAPAACSRNYYYTAVTGGTATCTACINGATADPGRSDTCSCSSVDAISYNTATAYSKTDGCGALPVLAHESGCLFTAAHGHLAAAESSH